MLTTIRIAFHYMDKDMMKNIIQSWNMQQW
ncbi:hypothetical protein E2C01_102469 [Portunus trituberculatus]|uniref:Uncharacterized protein n=1 Tax=Portunus trituberculatus TaxID=210409 RepID=A0A5B7KIJ1_PORTR|nr:hypothetical protein [Portunus trituberculatus]